MEPDSNIEHGSMSCHIRQKTTEDILETSWIDSVLTVFPNFVKSLAGFLGSSDF